jgi:2-polyprenyl-6-hydroxyphenyl methylase/3-demethylubiquinone-9 3-methyltransferase
MFIAMPNNMPENNVDWQEIAKFSAPGLDWWDPQGALATLHAINPLRLSYITKRLAIKNCKILDLGCGAGILAESLASAGAIVTGIDLNDQAITAGQQHLSATKIQQPNISLIYQVISSSELATKHTAYYDAITCMEMLEHVPNPQQIINDCAVLLKPGGHLFMSTLNRNWRSYLEAIIAAEYILKLLPQNTHDFAKFITPYELTCWANKAGLSITNFTGIRYNPLSKTFRLSTNIVSNYLAHATLTT